METQADDERMTTGVPGLDTVLAGGLLRGSTVLVAGPAGSGKTILASQLAFHRAAQGERVLYVTLLNESAERLIGHLRKLRFFDEERIPASMYFLGAYAEARENGLDALVSFLGRHVRQHQADMLVFDGLSIAESLAGDTLAFQTFLYELGATLQMSQCTGVFIAARRPELTGSEHYLLDIVIALRDETRGMRSLRDLQVLKFRGSDALRGRHLFEIDDGGVTLYPRLESLVAIRDHEVPAASELSRNGFGIQGLDEMLSGGLPGGSATLLAGAPGGGKTMLGLHFLAEGARRGENGLYYGLYESPARLLEKADAVGVDLRAAVERGDVTLRWQLPFGRQLDAMAEDLIEALDETGSQRVVIDGIDGMRRTGSGTQREASFFTALTILLRRRGVASLLTKELSLFSSEIDIGMDGLSAIVENVLLLRYVELDGRLRRLLSILKLRDSDYDSSLRELRITREGVEFLEASFEHAQHLLAGSASVPAGARGSQR